MSRLVKSCLALLLAVGTLLSACGAPAQPDGVSGDTANAGAAPPGAAPTGAGTRKPALELGLGALRPAATGPYRIYRDPNLSQSLIDGLGAYFGDMPVEFVATADEADLRLAHEGSLLVYEYIMTPLDRFSSVLSGVSYDELKGVWSGSLETPNFSTVYPDQALMPALQQLLGPPSSRVKPTPAADLTAAIWGDPMGLAIAPFEALTPRLLTLRLDGLSVVDNRLAQNQWPLAERAFLTPLTARGEEAIAELTGRPAISNRDPGKLTVLVMTGVTAMARGTAAAIEQAGDYAFPARLVGPELAAADLTIISNEIPFMPGCEVNNTRNNLLLCSSPEYYAALELSGVDAVGLSGNHQNDFGYTNMLKSLEFYREMGVPVYAGGADAAAALQTIYLEHNGNRLAFLGANQYGPLSYNSGTGEVVSAWAGADHPGSAKFSLEQMREGIRAASAQADLVLAEVQHTEFDAAGNYTIAPIPQQVADFQALKDAGAAIVTGVQAHAPQGVELRGDGIILYGLGNLYFDQTWSWRTRTGLVPRHAIYDGKLINSELLVTVIEPNMQLRWATNDERIAVLKTIYSASRW